MPLRVNLIVAASDWDAELIKDGWPQFRHHQVVTPQKSLSGFYVGEYVWTPDAQKLRASERLRLRGVLAPLLDEHSVEEVFPSTLLSW